MTDKKTVKFGDICREVKLTTKDPIADGYERYIGLEHLDSASLKIKRWGIIAEDNPSFTRVFKKGHILLGKRRPYLRKAAIAEFDGICSGDIIVVNKVDSSLLASLIPFILMSNSFWDFAVKNSSGSLSPRTKFSALASYSFSIPNEKKLSSLVNNLSKVDEVLGVVDIFQKSKEKLTRSFLFENLFPATNCNPFKVRIFREASLPESYKFYKLGDISSIKAGSTPVRSKLDRYYGDELSGIPWVKTLDLNEGLLNRTDEYVTKLAIAECSLHIHDEDTVLLAMYGGFNQIGRTSLLKVKGTTNQAVSAIKCNQDIVLPEYCILWLRTFRFLWKRYAASSRKDPNITKSDIENFPIWVPDTNTQKLIMAAHDNLNSISDVENALLKLQKALVNW